uniref:Nucleoporin NUP42 n=1 Tax=Parascaris univalens TaxID=6257 RepID=A0A915AH64_PARUN
MRPSSIVRCKFFAIGYCRNGDRCPFSHQTISHQCLPSQQDGRYAHIRHPNTSEIRNNEDYRGYPTMSYNEQWSRAINEGENAIHSNRHEYRNDKGVPGTSADGYDYRRMAAPPSFFSDRSRYRWVAPNLKKDSQRQTNPQIADTPHIDESPSLPKSYDNLDSPSDSPEHFPLREHNVSVSADQSSSRGGSNKEERTKFPDYYYSQVESLSEENLKQFEADSFDLEKIPEVPPPRCLC